MFLIVPRHFPEDNFPLENAFLSLTITLFLKELSREELLPIGEFSRLGTVQLGINCPREVVEGGILRIEIVQSHLQDTNKAMMMKKIENISIFPYNFFWGRGERVALVISTLFNNNFHIWGKLHDYGIILCKRQL